MSYYDTSHSESSLLHQGKRELLKYFSDCILQPLYCAQECSCLYYIAGETHWKSLGTSKTRTKPWSTHLVKTSLSIPPLSGLLNEIRARRAQKMTPSQNIQTHQPPRNKWMPIITSTDRRPQTSVLAQYTPFWLISWGLTICLQCRHQNRSWLE